MPELSNDNENLYNDALPVDEPVLPNDSLVRSLVRKCVAIAWITKTAALLRNMPESSDDDKSFADKSAV